MIKSWGFDFFPAPVNAEKGYAPGSNEHALDRQDPKELIDYFNFYLDLWTRAESLGFDGVFLSEHHFGGGYSPSPNLLLAALAGRTKTLRMGVMGMVVPYHNPWRLVEECGMLDALTAGRLEVGTAAGIPTELSRVGMTPEEARARYDEALQIIDAGLREPIISHQGKYWSFENLALQPRPVQARPPMWTTVISLESARKAARRGSKISTAFLSNEKAKEVFDAYNEEAAKVGNPTGPEQLGLRRQVLIDPSGAESSDRVGQYAKAFRNLLESRDNRTITPGRKALDTSGAHGYALGDDEFISGSPRQVAEQIMEQCRQCGAGHFMVVFAGHQSLQELERSWELFGTEVIPVLKRT